MKLKLNRESVSYEPDAGDAMRFPVRAVRAMPGPYRNSGRMPVQENHVPDQDCNVLRHPELIRQIEATLNRMQAGIDQLGEHVNNYKFPDSRDEERPRAA